MTHGHHYYDLAPLMLQPIAARSASTGAAVDISVGYRVLYTAASAARPTRFGDELLDMRVEFGRGVPRDELLDVRVRRGDAPGDGAAGGVIAVVQRYTGGECRAPAAAGQTTGRLLGGLTATLRLKCGPCGEEPEQTGAGEAVAPVLCSVKMSEDGCALSVEASVHASQCPLPRPLRRMGLDVGTAPGGADVVLDGMPSRAWSSHCAHPAACARLSAWRAAPSTRPDPAPRAADAGGDGIPTDLVSAANLTLYARVLFGSAAVLLSRLTPPAGVQIRVLRAEEGPVALSGAPNRQVAVGEAGLPLEALDAEPMQLVLEHRCTRQAAAARASGVARAVLRVHKHTPVHLMWRVDC